MTAKPTKIAKPTEIAEPTKKAEPTEKSTPSRETRPTGKGRRPEKPKLDSSMRLTKIPPPKRAVGTEPEAVVGHDVVAAAPDSPSAEKSDDAGAGTAAAPSTVVPETARSAPKSAIAHVGIVGAEPNDEDVEESRRPDRRARTLVPQLFAAIVLGFLVVAGAVGTLIPSGQVEDSRVQSDSEPGSPAEPDSMITPAPTQTPELVIPSVPTDTESSSGDPDSAGRGEPSTREQSSESGSPASVTPRTPTGRVDTGPADSTDPADGTVTGGGTDAGGDTDSGDQTGTGGGTGTDQEPDTDGDPDDGGTPVDPPVDGEDDPEPESVVGTVVEIVGGILL